MHLTPGAGAAIVSASPMLTMKKPSEAKACTDLRQMNGAHDIHVPVFKQYNDYAPMTKEWVFVQSYYISYLQKVRQKIFCLAVMIKKVMVFF